MERHDQANFHIATDEMFEFPDQIFQIVNNVVSHNGMHGAPFGKNDLFCFMWFLRLFLARKTHATKYFFQTAPHRTAHAEGFFYCKLFQNMLFTASIFPITKKSVKVAAHSIGFVQFLTGFARFFSSFEGFC